MSETEKKRSTHHAAGLVLGVLGIAVAVLLAYMTGIIGGGIAFLLGAAAVLLGAGALREKKGLAAIIAGGLAIVLAVSITALSISAVVKLRDTADALLREESDNATAEGEAAQEDNAPLLVQYADKPYLGPLGILLHASNASDSDQKQFRQELATLEAKTGLDTLVEGSPASQEEPDTEPTEAP